MPKQKRMTEREAWLYQAKLWDKPKKNYGKCCYEAVNPSNGIRGDGICIIIELMCRYDLISFKTRVSMERRIDNEREKLGLHHPYLFRCTKAGAVKRAALCRKFAQQCPKKGAKKCQSK